MRNLHKYYYKDYFSEHILGVDENGDDKLSFENLYLKEEKDRESDDGKKKDLSEKISAIEKKNAVVLGHRNSKLTGTDFVRENHNGEPTRELLDEATITLDETITSLDKSPERSYKTFELDVQYPGLVTGVGINHETKIVGEFKLGVHFDWTHGMPVVYGSSVKGVLRAWFKKFYKNSKNKYSECGVDEDDLLMDIFSGEKRDVEAERKKIEEEWRKMVDSGAVVDSASEKKKYEDEWKKKLEDVKNRIYKPKSIYNRDIFFDAVIIKADSQGRILCSDSITPHDENPLKNPTPITFLKIASGCIIQFRFLLQKSSVPAIGENGIPVKDDKGEYPSFTIDKKIGIFKEILTTVGIGAKTNVGYGQLKEI